MRQRHWKLDEIRSIELKTAKDVFTRRECFYVRIKTCKRLWRRVVINVKDATLAPQIHAALSQMHALHRSPGCTSGAPMTSIPAPVLVPPDATAIDNHYNAPE